MPLPTPAPALAPVPAPPSAQVLLRDEQAATYEVDMYSASHKLVLEVDGIHHFVHPSASADVGVMVQDQLMLWCSTVLESAPAGTKSITVAKLHTMLVASWDYQQVMAPEVRKALATPSQLERVRFGRGFFRLLFLVCLPSPWGVWLLFCSFWGMRTPVSGLRFKHASAPAQFDV